MFRSRPDGSSEDSESQVPIKSSPATFNRRKTTYTKVDKPVQKETKPPSPVHISPTLSSSGKSPSPTSSYRSQNTLKNDDQHLGRSPSPVQTSSLRRSPSPVDQSRM